MIERMAVDRAFLYLNPDENPASKQQAQQEWDSYLARRPYKDKYGRVHDPANVPEEQGLVDRPLVELVHRLARARHEGDAVLQLHLQTITRQALTRIIETDQRHKSSEVVDQGSYFDMTESRVERLQERLAVRDQESQTARLPAQNGSKPLPATGGLPELSLRVVQYDSRRLFSNPARVRYASMRQAEQGQPRKAQLTEEYTEQGTVLDWQLHKYSRSPQLRQILIYTEDHKPYYVTGRIMYDLAEARERSMSVPWAVGQSLPVAVVGERWALLQEAAPIKKAIIATDEVWEGDEVPSGSMLASEDKSPFQEAEEVLAQNSQPQATEKGKPNRRRVLAAVASFATAAALRNRLRGNKEMSMEKRRRHKKQLIGGVALLGVGAAMYMGAKHFGVEPAGWWAKEGMTPVAQSASNIAPKIQFNARLDALPPATPTFADTSPQSAVLQPLSPKANSKPNWLKRLAASRPWRKKARR